MFYTVWKEALYAWDKYKGFAGVINGPTTPWFTVYKPGVALKVAWDNLKYFDEDHKECCGDNKQSG